MYNKAGAAIKDAFISAVSPKVRKLARKAVCDGAIEFGKSLADDTVVGVVFGFVENAYQKAVASYFSEEEPQ